MSVRDAGFHDGHTSAQITTSTCNLTHSSLARCFSINVLDVEQRCRDAEQRLNRERWRPIMNGDLRRMDRVISRLACIELDGLNE